MGCESSNVSSLDQKINNIKDIQKELSPNHENENQEENEEHENEEEEENEENIKEKEHKTKRKYSQELEGTRVTKNLSKKTSFNEHQLTNGENGEILTKKELKKIKAITKDYSQDDPDHGVFVDLELIKSSKLNFTEMDMARMIITAQTKYKQKEKYYKIGKRDIDLDKTQIKRAAQIICERVKSYKAKLKDDFDRTKPINDPLLKDHLIKVGFKELTEHLLNKTCFKDKGTDKSEISDALKYGSKKGNIYKVMVIEIV